MANYNYRRNYDEDRDPYEYYEMDDREYDEKEYILREVYGTMGKDDIFSREDYLEMWTEICDLFPEYDFLTYLRDWEYNTYPDVKVYLTKFKNPSKSTLAKEKEGLKEFFEEISEYADICDLNYEILCTLVENGEYSYKFYSADTDAKVDYEEYEIYIPRKNDDAETKNLNRKILEPVIHNFATYWGKL